MKNKNYFFLLLLTATFSFQNCNSTKSTTSSENTSTTTKEEKTVEMVNTVKSYTVKVGQKLTYSADVHASTGKGCKAHSEDDAIVKLVGSKINYNQPQVENMDGGDAGKEVFTFEAVAVGKTKVTINDYMRGAVEKTYVIEIIVE